MLLLSCELDNYDKGEGELSLMQADFVEAHADHNRYIDYVVTDEGERLSIGEEMTAKWVTTADSLYRAYLYYKKVGTVAEDVTIGQVAAVGIHRADYFDGRLTTDPVRFESAWVSTSKRYLNLSIYLMMGDSSDEKAIHHIGMLGDTLKANTDGTRTWHVRLLHDQGSMPEYYSQRAYLSIPLYEVDADSIHLTVNTYSGLVTKQFRIR